MSSRRPATTPHQAGQIRFAIGTEGLSQRKTANRLNVCKTTVCRVMKGLIHPDQEPIPLDGKSVRRPIGRRS